MKILNILLIKIFNGKWTLCSKPLCWYVSFILMIVGSFRWLFTSCIIYTGPTCTVKVERGRNKWRKQGQPKRDWSLTLCASILESSHQRHNLGVLRAVSHWSPWGSHGGSLCFSQGWRTSSHRQQTAKSSPKGFPPLCPGFGKTFGEEPRWNSSVTSAPRWRREMHHLVMKHSIWYPPRQETEKRWEMRLNT